jgi:sugar phosphate isomerase/epimerase
MVLDIKQAYRADENVYDFINKIGTSIKHIHISDHDAENSCIPPLSGCFDFNGFFNELKKIDYSGKFMIELYDNSYKDEQEIYTSYKKIKELLVDY